MIEDFLKNNDNAIKIFWTTGILVIIFVNNDIAIFDNFDIEKMSQLREFVLQTIAMSLGTDVLKSQNGIHIPFHRVEINTRYSSISQSLRFYTDLIFINLKNE